MQRGFVFGPAVYGHWTLSPFAAHHGQLDDFRLGHLVQESQKFFTQDLLHARQVSRTSYKFLNFPGSAN